MADPKLARTSVVIKYTGDDGYRYEMTAKAGKGSVNHRTGGEVPPQKALLDALQELARITALFGFEKEAQQVFEDARIAVFEWLGRRPNAGATEGDKLDAALKAADGVAVSRTTQEQSDGRSIGNHDCEQRAPHGAVGGSAVHPGAGPGAADLGGDVHLGQLDQPSGERLAGATEAAQTVALAAPGVALPREGQQ